MCRLIISYAWRTAWTLGRCPLLSLLATLSKRTSYYLSVKWSLRWSFFRLAAPLLARWFNGNIIASRAADRGSIPGCGRSASHQTASGTPSAGDAHSLVRRTNPPTASSVPRCGVAQGYRKGDEHLGQSQKMVVTWPCILYFVSLTWKPNPQFRVRVYPPTGKRWNQRLSSPSHLGMKCLWSAVPVTLWLETLLSRVWREQRFYSLTLLPVY